MIVTDEPLPSNDIKIILILQKLYFFPIDTEFCSNCTHYQTNHTVKSSLEYWVRLMLHK